MAQLAAGQVSCKESLGFLSWIPTPDCVKGDLIWQNLACWKGLDLTSYPLISESETRADSCDVLVMFLSVFELSTALNGSCWRLLSCICAAMLIFLFLKKRHLAAWEQFVQHFEVCCVLFIVRCSQFGYLCSVWATQAWFFSHCFQGKLKLRNFISLEAVFPYRLKEEISHRMELSCSKRKGYQSYSNEDTNSCR